MAYCVRCPIGTERTEGAVCEPCPAGATGTMTANGALCQNCPPGKYESSGTCVECPAGTYNPSKGAAGLSACSACPKGTYSDSPGANSLGVCKQCSPGSYSEVIGSSDIGDCTPCPEGTYSDKLGAAAADACILCPDGTSTNALGAATVAACETCPLGSLLRTSDDGSQVRDECPRGTWFQPALDGGNSTCIPCAIGKYGTRPGAISEEIGCAECPAGTYADAPGTETCAACPPRRTTDTLGTANHLACRCEAGAYATQAVFSPAEQACADCPERGAVCEPGRLPAAAPGFWHDPRSDTSLFFECSPAEACAGGDLYAGNMTARCALAALEALGDDEVQEACGNVAMEGAGPPQSATEAAALIADPGLLCSAAYARPRCAQCAPNFYRLSSACQPCPDMQWLMLAAVLVGVCVMSAAAAVIVRSGVSLAPLTIGVDYFQTLARVSSVRAGWSATASTVLDWTRVFEIDVELTAPECMVEASFAEMWSAVMLLPVICFGLLLAGHVVLVAVALAKAQGHPANTPGYARALISIHLRRFASEALLLLQVAYVQLSVKSLSALDCTSLPDGKQALDASPDIICWEGEHLALVGRAMVALLVYLVGVPMLFAGVLRYVARVLRSLAQRQYGGRAAPRRLRDMVPQRIRKASPQQQAEWVVAADRWERRLFAVHQMASSLFERFRPEHMRWLLVIMARKVVLSAVTVLQSSRPGVQLAGFAATLFVALVAQIKARPYEGIDDSRVKQRLESRTASHIRRQKYSNSSRWPRLRISAYRTFLDPNAMEEASLMSSMAIVLCAMVYHSSRVSEQAGYPMDAGALQLLDAFLVCVVVCVSLYMVALVVIPLVASGAWGKGKKDPVMDRARHGASGASQTCRVNPMVASTRPPIAHRAGTVQRPRGAAATSIPKHAVP